MTDETIAFVRKFLKRAVAEPGVRGVLVVAYDHEGELLVEAKTESAELTRWMLAKAAEGVMQPPTKTYETETS